MTVAVAVAVAVTAVTAGVAAAVATEGAVLSCLSSLKRCIFP